MRRALSSGPLCWAQPQRRPSGRGIGTRRRGRFRRDRFLRGRGLHRRDLGLVLFRLLGLVLRSPRDRRSSVFGRRVLWQLGFLDLRLLLGERGRSHRRVGIRSRRQVGRPRACGEAISRPISIAGAPRARRRRRSADARPPAPRRRDAARRRRPLRKSRAAGKAFARDRGQTSLISRSRLCRCAAAGAPPARRERPRAPPA